MVLHSQEEAEEAHHLQKAAEAAAGPSWKGRGEAEELADQHLTEVVAAVEPRKREVEVGEGYLKWAVEEAVYPRSGVTAQGGAVEGEGHLMQEAVEWVAPQTMAEEEWAAREKDAAGVS